MPYYHSYQSLEQIAAGNSTAFRRISGEEVSRLKDIVFKWAKEERTTFFRTSINAETLYTFRQEVKAVKEFSLNTPSRKVLFIRDQAEGFYANINYDVDDKKGQIKFDGEFTRTHQQKVVEYALQRADQKFGIGNYIKWAMYKHHLFGDALQQWIREIDNDISIYQPDTGLTQLQKFFDPPGTFYTPENLLVICSNEVGDLVHEALMGNFDPDAKLMMYSRNVYLNKDLENVMVDYQTVHGSADDKVMDEKQEEEEVLPYATLRAAAEIAEDVLGIRGTKRLMNTAIISPRSDQTQKTIEILNTIYSHFDIPRYETSIGRKA